MARQKIDVQQIGWSEAVDQDVTFANSASFGNNVAISGSLSINQAAAAGSQVFVTTEGKVGIGTSTPTYKLTVGGSMEVGEYIYHRNDADTFIRFEANNISLSAGGTSITYDGTDVEVPNNLIVSGSTSVEDYMILSVTADNTDIQTGTSQMTFRAPFAMELYQVPRASLSTASTSGAVTVDINNGGSTIFSTNLTIDANESTSTTAATAAVLSQTSIADDSQITVDIDGAGTGARGLKVTLFYRRIV